MNNSVLSNRSCDSLLADRWDSGIDWPDRRPEVAASQDAAGGEEVERPKRGWLSCGSPRREVDGSNSSNDIAAPVPNVPPTHWVRSGDSGM